MLRSDLCDFSDVHIVVKGEITITRGSNSSRKNGPLALRNNAPFIGCISKTNATLTDNAEDLDVAICIICLNKVKIIQKQQVVYGINTEMN